MQFYYFVQLAFLGVAVLLCGISFAMNIAYAAIFDGYEIDTGYITMTDEYYEESRGRDSRTKDFICLSDSECSSFTSAYVDTIIACTIGGITLALLLIRILFKKFTRQYSLAISLSIYMGCIASGVVGTYSIIILEISNEYYNLIYGTLAVIIIYTCLFFIAVAVQCKIYSMERVSRRNAK